MEIWYIAAVVGLAVVVIGLELMRRDRRTRTAEHTAQSYYGPLPERDAERAEVNDPAQFGQVSPGAVTPSSVGSPEEFYESTGVGRGGPEHLSGPPSTAARGGYEDRSPQAAHPSGTRDWVMDNEPSDDGQRRVPLPLVAGVGATLGLVVFGLIRWRTRRRSRIERLRERARRATTAAGKVAATAGGRAAALPSTLSDSFDELDPRAKAGGGGALATSLLLYLALRRWQRERDRDAEARRLAEEAAASAAARGGRLLGASLGTTWLADRAKQLNLPGAGERLPDEVPVWTLIAAGLTLAAIGTLVARGGQREANWTGAMVADSAPAREPPASP